MTSTAIAKNDKIYTVEEYFEFEKNSEIRYEYHYGKLLPMPGESITANQIASNCNRNLWIELKGKDFIITQNDVKTMVKDEKLYRYPGVSVSEKSDKSNSHVVTKPILLVEVFSEGSSKTDHEDKLKEYAAMPSVQYYLIISQYELSVKIYSRQTKGWQFEHLTELDDIAYFPLLSCQLSLNNIYEDVELTDNQSDTQ